MYIGNDLQVAESGNKIIDDISSSFNGSTTSFALLVGGAAPVPFPINTQQIYISVNGVIQEPDPTGSAGFKLLGNNIVFSSAPANGHAFFGVILSGADYVTVGTEFPAGSATAPSITFGTDSDTGLFSVTGGTMGFTSDGTQTFTMDGNGFNFPDNKKVQVGSGNDLQLYHSGTNSVIDNNTGGLYLRNNVASDVGGDIFIQAKSGENSAIFTHDGAVTIHFDNSARLATTNTGINVTGSVVDDGATHDGDVTFTGAAANVVWDKSDNALEFTDNSKATFGSSADLTITHDGSHSYIDESGTGDLKIRSNGNGVVLGKTDGENTARFLTDGAVELYHNNVKKFETYASGIIVYGSEGADGLLNLYADEGDDNADKWRLQADTNGSFYLRNYASGNWETNIRAAGDGTVELYHNNSKTFETTSSGVDVTGILQCDEFKLLDGEHAKFGTGEDLRIYHDGTTSILKNNTGNLHIRSDGNITLQDKTASETLANFADNGAVDLYYDNSKKFETTSIGSTITGSLTINNSNYDGLIVKNNDDGSNGAYITLINDSASPSNADIAGIVNFRGKDSSGNDTTYGQIRSYTTDINDGQESGEMTFSVRNSNTFEEKIRITAAGSVGIGTTTPRGSSTYQGLEISGTSGGVITYSVNETEKWNVYGADGVYGIYDRVNTRYNLKCHDDGDVELPTGNLKVTSSKGITALGVDNSTYGELTVKVAALDGSGSANAATFKRGSNAAINLAFPSGGGIDFSATGDSTGSGISMQGELLDDYERGTWGSINTGADSCTFSHNWYVKVGRQVTCNVRLSGITNGDSDALTLNLPFANGTVEASGAAACDTFNMPSDWVLMNSYAYNGKLYILASRDNAGWENLLGNMTATNSTIIMNITYLANA